MKSNFIRLQRHLKPSVEKEIYIDVSIPDKAYDYAQVSILLAGSKKHIIFRNLTVTSFEESR